MEDKKRKVVAFKAKLIACIAISIFWLLLGAFSFLKSPIPIAEEVSEIIATLLLGIFSTSSIVGLLYLSIKWVIKD